MAMPLVLLPGFMSDLRIWGPQIEALAADTTLILPPLGPSDHVGGMAEAVLGHLPTRFALAGHALGAHVAMEVLRRAPDRVERIALLSAGCMAEQPGLAAERDMRLVRAKAGRLGDVIREDIPPGALADGPLRAALLEFLADMAEGFGPGAYQNHTRAMQRRPDQQRNLRNARLPSLVLGGREDTLIRPQRLEFMAGLLPHATLRIIEGAGHLPMLERPDQVTGALRDWMAMTAKASLLK